MPAPTGTGVYILVLSPASGFEGRAPMSGLSVQGVSGPACGSKYAVEGVRFGLVPLDLTTLTGNSGTQALISDIQTLISQLAKQSASASLSRLHNLLAHLCFGTEERKGLVVEPFRQTADGSSPYIDVGALTALRALGLLTDCDVPLALLFWTTNGVQFVDMGSVRRRPVSGPPSQFWPLAVAGGYPITGEAVSIQFQEQIADITRANTPQDQLALFGASDAFGYLPSIGLIPITGVNSARGFVVPKFFQNIPHRDPVFIEGARLEHVVRIALAYPPIKLVGSQNDQEMIWLYAVRENAQAIDNSPLNPLQRYLVFTSGHIPYQGDAQYDLARALYSNFSSVMTR